MPFKSEQFIIAQTDLSKAIDIDDNRGRSVPKNLNLIEEGFLSKDTGVSLFGATETTDCHSLFHYKKKSGTTYTIRIKGTKMQTYNATTGLWADTASSPTFTADAKMGYVVYDGNLYFGNAVQSFYKWDGTTFTEYASAPKGNILEAFEDRIFVSGVIAEPLTVYYSDINTPGTFNVASVLKPLGTDSVTFLANYYGQLLIFKQSSIVKFTFVYDGVTDLYIPKLEVQSNNYGACSRKAVIWVENDLWFSTGREVRAIGFKDQQTGILGVNKSVISDDIKETLYTIDVANYSKVAVFYNNRRFYLSVPISSATNNTVFVCHLLYGNAWTKYVSRIKTSVGEFVAINGVVHTTKSVTPFGVLKWDESLLNDNGVAISSEVYFRKTEDKDFNKFSLYRYLDIMFKNLSGRMTVTVLQDAYDVRSSKTKTFFIGQPLENMDNPLGEVDFGQSLVADAFGEDVSASPFEKKRISFLIKAQTLTIGIANTALSETFTICQYILFGSKQPRKLFKPAGIISMT